MADKLRLGVAYWPFFCDAAAKQEQGNQQEKPSMKSSQLLALVVALLTLSLPACSKHKEQTEVEEHKIVVTSPKVMDVTITQKYVCQIRSQRNIEVCALQGGYLEPTLLKEGQEVTKDQVLFSVNPTLFEAKYAAEVAEAELARLELKNTQSLFDQQPPVVSLNEVLLFKAKLQKAEAKRDLAKRELDFTKVRAKFPGIIDRLKKRDGSLIKEGDVLTTLSDNSLMWVYFNMPEARYLEYMTTPAKVKAEERIELVLADGGKFLVGFKLTEKSLASARAAGVPTRVLDKLNPLKSKEFRDRK